MEGWSEIDDDVIEDNKLSARSTKSIKSARDKSPRENKENSLKRQKTKDHLLKRQKSKEALSPTKSKPSKAKTPDSKKGTLKNENTKRKISMKQDPARYDKFLKTSSSFQRKLAKGTSGLNQSTSSNSGVVDRKVRSSSRIAASASSIKMSATAKQGVSSSRKNTSINRTANAKKLRRKSSVRKTLDTAATAGRRKIMTRSSSSNLLKSKQASKETPVQEKPKNLKRTVAKTSLDSTDMLKEEKPISSKENDAKRQRIGSLPLPTISVTSPDKFSSSSNVPMSPSPFVIETTSLSNKVGNRLCPLGKRSRVPATGMVSNFLRDHRAASISVFSPVQEDEDNTEDVFVGVPDVGKLNHTDNPPRALRQKIRRQSNFKLVRLNSIKNKRRSMLRTSQKLR